MSYAFRALYFRTEYFFRAKFLFLKTQKRAVPANVRLEWLWFYVFGRSKQSRRVPVQL